MKVGYILSLFTSSVLSLPQGMVRVPVNQDTTQDDMGMGTQLPRARPVQPRQRISPAANNPAVPSASREGINAICSWSTVHYQWCETVCRTVSSQQALEYHVDCTTLSASQPRAAQVPQAEPVARQQAPMEAPLPLEPIAQSPPSLPMPVQRVPQPMPQQLPDRQIPQQLPERQVPESILPEAASGHVGGPTIAPQQQLPPRPMTPSAPADAEGLIPTGPISRGQLPPPNGNTRSELPMSDMPAGASGLPMTSSGPGMSNNSPMSPPVASGNGQSTGPLMPPMLRNTQLPSGSNSQSAGIPGPMPASPPMSSRPSDGNMNSNGLPPPLGPGVRQNPGPDLPGPRGLPSGPMGPGATNSSPMIPNEGMMSPGNNMNPRGPPLGNNQGPPMGGPVPPPPDGPPPSNQRPAQRRPGPNDPIVF